MSVDAGAPRDATGTGAARGARSDGGGRRPKGRPEGGERPMVPRASFTSYYGRPVVKPSPWKADIPAYLFLGGLAGGSSILAAGADLTSRAALRRTVRIGALVSIGVSFAALIHDLGRPERLVNMLRVAKPTSPMSVGTWILTAYGPPAGAVAASEMTVLLTRRLEWLGALLGASSRPAGIAAAALGAGVASYTAVLLSDTTWHEARREQGVENQSRRSLRGLKMVGGRSRPSVCTIGRAPAVLLGALCPRISWPGRQLRLFG